MKIEEHYYEDKHLKIEEQYHEDKPLKYHEDEYTFTKIYEDNL